MNDYYRKLTAMCMLLVGAFLLGEHFYVHGGFDVEDLIGHEWYGVWAILGAIIIMARYRGKYIISTERFK